MARKVSDSGDGLSRPDGAGSSESEQDRKSRIALARRSLLTRGGVVAAGVVGAGALGAVAAGSASAQSGDPVLQDTVNSAGSSATPTELDADNDTAPAFILTNTGVDSSNNGAGPNVRLTTAAGGTSGPFEPTGSTEGGDLTSTADGSLWYTHQFLTSSGTTEIVPAPVHTEATANVYAGLSTPQRVLDTRTASLRTNVINPGVLNSSGQLPTGQTLYLNLDNQVIFADNIIANITVTSTTAAGFLTIWSGEGTRPSSSNIDWSAASVTLANLTSSVVGSYPPNTTTTPTYENVIAIYADTTTHVIVDAFAFTMPGFEYANNFTPAISNSNRASRLQRAQAKVRAAAKLRAAKKA
jgi:hypothetical protein